MTLIDGKAISEQVKQEIAAEVAEIVAQGGKRPHLAAILVGHDGGSETYVAAKVKACEVCGFKSSLIRYEADVTEEELRKIYEDAYKDEQFVRFLNAGVCPETRWVEGSNYVDVNVKLDERTHRVIMMGAMDNLVKGAAGQAVQNMNLMFGFDEAEGLHQIPMLP